MTDRASASTPVPAGDDTPVTPEPPHSERRRPDLPPAAPPEEAPDPHHAKLSAPVGRHLLILSLTALGVVYGDIGTSPLYTVKEAFSARHGLMPTAPNVVGIMSLVIWSIILVVVVKYLVFILEADNHGEGGVLALLALVLQRQHRSNDRRRRQLFIILGVFGTALLFGDGLITPAISVLSAVEGLEIVAPPLSHVVVPATMGILLLLFMVQRYGTALVGRAFGPVTLVWFLVIGMLGLIEITRAPRIVAAINPWHAVRFLAGHGTIGFISLGGVFLSVTGAEALYADMGHFGKRPIRLAFFTLVLPSLVLNYLGQGALLLSDPRAIENPFYLLAPRWALYPVLFLATLATIVASQALISGVFSLAQQAMQLGFIPRMTIVHTSAREHGQIYVPQINTALAVGTLLIVAGFKSSDALGAAYGIAVTGTMAITTLLFAVVTRSRWGWPLWRVIGLAVFFLMFDLAFLGANALKLMQGGWVPLLIAVAVLTLMTTWKRGREALYGIMKSGSLPIDLLLNEIRRRPPPRVAGTAVFLTSDAEGASVVLLHHLKHNKALHEQVVLLSVLPTDVPYVKEADRVEVKPLGEGFFRVLVHTGFMETPNIPELLAMCVDRGIRARPMETSYYLGREMLLPTGSSRMAGWRKRLFIVMSRNAQSAARYFGLPSNRVVELGAQIEF
ncbi:MAG: potassium transporter Kup [Gemmatimonadetes bacterium]|nr:potassium transporter Kup [Gemmatimonadota bacterium]